MVIKPAGSHHTAVCLTDSGLPAGKVKSEQDQRRWMPRCSAAIVDFTGGAGMGGWGGGPALSDGMSCGCVLIPASAYWHIPQTA